MIANKEQLVNEILKRLTNKNDIVIHTEVFARHIHLSEDHIAQLFGKNYVLTAERDIGQGEFAAKERLVVVGPSGAIEHIRVVGPVVARTRVELPASDSYHIGAFLQWSVPESEKDGSELTIVGPIGSIRGKFGIRTRRHLHLSPAAALQMGLSDGDVVNAEFTTESGGVLFGIAVIVNERFTPSLHIDTDEANAFGLSCGMPAKIIKTEERWK